jgi:hypothetical protein
MTQGVIPFKYESDRQNGKMTGFGGLPVYLDLMEAAGLSKSIDKQIKARSDSQGWTDSQVILSLMLLNLSGGDCVDDLNCLEKDEGLCHLIKRTEKHGLRRQQRRDFLRRWRKERQRTFPSPSSVFRYLSLFRNHGQEELRESGKAFIPVSNEYLRGFAEVNREFLSFVQKHNRERTATLDMDATLVEDDFGDNTAWWWIMILSLNLNNAMKSFVLGKAWITRRMKALRFHLINLPAKVVERSRELFVKLPKNHPGIGWLINIRTRIALLAESSPGLSVC